MILRIASRGSQLARWQAEHVRDRIRSVRPDIQVEIHIVRTTGDRITDVPLSQVGDRALFTKEVDQTVLDGHAHAAVHSLKDLPTQTPEGIALGAITTREDPRDAYIPAPGRPEKLAQLPEGARVGTSSLRRRALLLHVRPDLTVEDLRGNLDTRLARVEAGDYDAVILAAAGIRRLGRENAVGQWLEPPAWLPAAGQGALAIAIREDDEATRAIVAQLDDPDARAAITAERSFLAELQGGCQVPIGTLATIDGGTLRLAGVVADLAGRTVIRGETQGPRSTAAELGSRLADELLRRGAHEILDSIRRVDTGSLPPAETP